MLRNNNCFTSRDDSSGGESLPTDRTTFNKHAPKLDGTAQAYSWYLLAKGIGYDPFLIEAESNDGRTLKFRFIDCGTGKVIVRDTPHAISLADWKLIWPDSPSTLPSAGDISGGRTIGIVMLNPVTLKSHGELHRDALNANTDNAFADGKWPRTSSERLAIMLAKAVRELEDRAPDSELLPELRGLL